MEQSISWVIFKCDTFVTLNVLITEAFADKTEPKNSGFQLI